MQPSQGARLRTLHFCKSQHRPACSGNAGAHRHGLRADSECLSQRTSRREAGPRRALAHAQDPLSQCARGPRLSILGWRSGPGCASARAANRAKGPSPRPAQAGGPPPADRDRLGCGWGMGEQLPAGRSVRHGAASRVRGARGWGVWEEGDLEAGACADVTGCAVMGCET